MGDWVEEERGEIWRRGHNFVI